MNLDHEPLSPAQLYARRAARQRARLCQLRKQLAVPAVVGLAVLLWQLTSDFGSPLIVLAGMVLMVPLIATYTVRL